MQASSTPSPRTNTFTSFGPRFPDLQWDDDNNGLCENCFPETQRRGSQGSIQITLVPTYLIITIGLTCY